MCIYNTDWLGGGAQIIYHRITNSFPQESRFSFYQRDLWWVLFLFFPFYSYLSSSSRLILVHMVPECIWGFLEPPFQFRCLDDDDLGWGGISGLPTGKGSIKRGKSKWQQVLQNEKDKSSIKRVALSIWRIKGCINRISNQAGRQTKYGPWAGCWDSETAPIYYTAHQPLYPLKIIQKD